MADLCKAGVTYAVPARLCHYWEESGNRYKLEWPYNGSQNCTSVLTVVCGTYMYNYLTTEMIEVTFVVAV